MKIATIIAVLCIGFAPLFCFSNSTAPRLLVLTDIENEPDDTQSLVRLLLYANEIDIQGIVATTSTWKKQSIAPDTIRDVINAYGEVRPNLLHHAKGYPTTDSLLKLVKSGKPLYGMQGVGDGQNSEGSDWIISVLEQDDKRPLWINAWGGVNTLAQALYTLRKTKTPSELKQLISKLRVYTISDQDDSGAWIRSEFPELFYIVSPGDDYHNATWIAINKTIEGIDNTRISNTWLLNNIQQGHGPLGAIYPDVAWGMEGDTPAFLYLVPNGLNAPEHPNWGSWGGRYELYQPDPSTLKRGFSDVPLIPETRKIWTNASDNYTPYVKQEFGRAVGKMSTSFTGNHVTLWRWRDDFQNDFAARMDWCTHTYADANHPPQPKLSGDTHYVVRPGERVTLSAKASSDPDGDHLSYLWFQYPEAGTSSQIVDIHHAENTHSVYVVAPNVKQHETFHFILKVTDHGSPSLSRYKRIIMEVKPNS